MERQNISSTQPDDLIRQARKQQSQIDWISTRLEKAENSGFTNLNKDQILTESKSLI
ncbi:CopG family transcriptional regulator [Polaribacter sp. SA4-12]|uniref:CopG family transcriptional regulator n=1 Tax=Polaribacter sp. SA4-12 TaxID=1312072 RepID=UPI0012F762F4|nr:CopG family transcriptional regulator [Polaribacter sp. SA4-12]